jgi:predicted porin
MKKLLLGMMIVPAVTVQAADLTPYLLLNKEYRSIDQEKSANMGSSSGITDVDGFESRIGMKGSAALENDMTANGKIELGVNSNRDNGNGERIRIRLAQMDVNSKYGVLTIGKHWNPNTLKMLALDPFTGTGAQLLGLESGDVKGAQGGNFGMKARYFNDGITYKTPEFSGFHASVTFDQSNDTLDKDADGGTEKWTTLLANYGRAFGDNNLNVHITHAMGNIETVAGNPLDNNESFTTIAAKFHNKMFGFSAGYTMESLGEATDINSAKFDDERTHMLLAGWYNINKLTLGVNYGVSKWDDKSDFASLGDKKGGEQSQIGLGAIYKLSKNFKTRLQYRMQTIENKGTTAVAGTSNKNDANAIILGATLAL